MAILLAIQFINATLGWYETTKAGDAVAALKASLKPQVWTNPRRGLLGSGRKIKGFCIQRRGFRQEAAPLSVA
jgi:hypothetical protein